VMNFVEVVIRFWDTFGWPGVLVIIGLVLFIFRKYLWGLFYDYVVDGVLSFADEFLDPLLDLTGIGAPIPWEPGDLLAAIIIFKKERHISGRGVAFIVAAEALSFGIEPLLEMLPGGSIIAAPVGWFFNVFPAVSLSRMLFSKTDKALREEKLLSSEIALGKDAGVSVHREEEVLGQLRGLIHKEWFVEADELYRRERPDQRLARLLCEAVDKEVALTVESMRSLSSLPVEAPPEIIGILEQGIVDAQSLLGEARAHEKRFAGFFSRLVGMPPRPDEIKQALVLAREAHRVLVSAAQAFDDAYREWREELLSSQQQGEND